MKTSNTHLQYSENSQAHLWSMRHSEAISTVSLSSFSKDSQFSAWRSSLPKRGMYNYWNISTESTISLDQLKLVETTTSGKTIEIALEREENPIPALQRLLADRLVPEQAKESEHPPFIRGMMGVFSYDSAKRFERLTEFKVSSETPELQFCIPETLLIQEEQQSRVWISVSKLLSYETALAKAQELADFVSSPLSKRALGDNCEQIERVSLEKLPWVSTRDEFEQQVLKAKEYIKAGDIFQVVLSNKLRLERVLSPVQLYDALLNKNKSSFHFLFPAGQSHVVGASPEIMLRSSEQAGRFLMRLVAGTYPKRSLETSTRNELSSILEDEKETAEHIMLVDHCRNDVGRVSTIGSVSVDELLTVEELKDVFHLISQVSGSMLPECSIFDTIPSCSPIATLTGTPKIRAMDIISELEPFPRGFFGGFAGLIGFDNYIDTSVIIRSCIIDSDSIEIYAGAGIVNDSVPSHEFEECLWKVQTLIDLIFSESSSK